jgi:hypothetical protein
MEIHQISNDVISISIWWSPKTFQTQQHIWVHCVNSVVLTCSCSYWAWDSCNGHITRSPGMREILWQKETWGKEPRRWWPLDRYLRTSCLYPLGSKSDQPYRTRNWTGIFYKSSVGVLCSLKVFKLYLPFKVILLVTATWTVWLPNWPDIHVSWKYTILETSLRVHHH